MRDNKLNDIGPEREQGVGDIWKETGGVVGGVVDGVLAVSLEGIVGDFFAIFD